MKAKIFLGLSSIILLYACPGTPTPSTSGTISVQLQGVVAQYWTLKRSATQYDPIEYYPSLDEYAYCGNNLLHHLLPTDQLQDQTTTGCMSEPDRMAPMMREIRKDSLGFLSRNSGVDSGKKGVMTFQFGKAEHVLIQPRNADEMGLLQSKARR